MMTIAVPAARIGATTAALVLAAAVTLAATACSDESTPAGPGECTAANCPLGCCAGGYCQLGSSIAACGSGGRACQVCPSGQSCSGGTCGGGTSSGSCNHVSCPQGCCSTAGTCVSPATDFQCGTSGLLCKACGADQKCSLGQCVARQAGCVGCPGCCQNDTCMPGNTTAACGIGGGACQGCTGGTVCTAGSCKAPAQSCDATTCASGCCTGDGACVTFAKQDKTVCGKGGGACSVCAETALSCTQGTCVEQQGCASVCSSGCCNTADQCVAFAQQDSIGCGNAGAACAPCPPQTSCVDGQCVGGGAWEIWAISAQIAPMMPDGSAWDYSWVSNPNPDPFFGIARGSATWTWQYDYSSTVDNSFTPQWNEKVAVMQEAELLDPGGVNFAVYDDDIGFGTDNDLIGWCNLTLELATLQNGTFTIGACGDGVTNLVVKFVKQP